MMDPIFLAYPRSKFVYFYPFNDAFNLENFWTLWVKLNAYTGHILLDLKFPTWSTRTLGGTWEISKGTQDLSLIQS